MSPHIVIYLPKQRLDETVSLSNKNADSLNNSFTGSIMDRLKLLEYNAILIVGRETVKISSGLRVYQPPVFQTWKKLQTVPFNAKRQAEKVLRYSSAIEL